MTIESPQSHFVDPSPEGYPDLFKYPASKKDELKVRILEVDSSFTIYSIANRTLNEYLRSSNERFTRLSDTSVDMYEELDLLKSSVAVSKMYLTLRQELPIVGISDEEFIDMFKFFTKINSKVSEKLFHGIHRENGIERIKIDNVRGQQAKTINKILEEHSAPKPWFKGTKAEWRDFLINHSIFLFNFMDKDTKTSANDDIRIQGVTYQNGMPDWFDGLDEGILPSDEIVEQEILEDTQDAKRINTDLDQLLKSQKYIVKEERRKTYGFAKMVEKTKNKLELSVDNFPLLLISLISCHTGGFTLKPDAEERFAAGKIPFDYLESSELIEQTIDNFLAKEERLLCKETVAQWIEDSLEKSKSISQDLKVIDPDFGRVSILLLDSVGGDTRAATEFKKTLGTNKRLYYSLTKDIAPLLIHVTADELAYLKEIIKEYGVKTAGHAILEIAEAISYHSTDFSNNLPKESQSAINRLRTYTKKVLIRDHIDLYDAMANTLLIDEEDIPAATEENTFEEKALKIETAAIAVESANIGLGNLADWQLIYSNNRSLSENHLDPIDGQSLEEREKALEEYVVQNGISCSVKIGSIIRAFDWLVTVPEEKEWLAMRKEVDGVTFKKKKRGRVRILYRMDPETKKIIFFLHQKKDWSYGF